MESITLRRAAFLRRLSAASERRNEFPLSEIVAALELGENLCDLAQRFGLLPDAKEEAHLRRDWYGEGEPGRRSRWWPAYDVESIVRQAYLQALRFVVGMDLPLTAYWVSGIDDFVVPVLPSKHQITMLLLTPHPQGEAGQRVDDGLAVIYERDGQVVVDPGTMKG